MSLLSFLPVIDKVLDRILPDKAAKAEAQYKLLALADQAEGRVLEAELKQTLAAAGIVQAEVGGSGLKANWRPIMMLTFGALIVARFLGWDAPGVSEAEYLELWGLIKLGLGGYVVGRSAEKIVPQIVASLK